MEKEVQAAGDEIFIDHNSKKNNESNDRNTSMEVDNSTTNDNVNNTQMKEKSNDQKADSECDNGSDINLVVAKAKKAADSLWVILHAQTCRRHNCTRSCYEAKRILLHLKTCKASVDGNNFTCPHNFKGCSQAKRLLAHYRRCRENRNLQSSCLICSFLSRRARNFVEGNASSGSHVDSECRRAASLSPIRTAIVGRHVKCEPRCNDNRTMIDKTSNSKVMPPPPPRFPLKPCLRVDAKQNMNDISSDARDGKKRSLSFAVDGSDKHFNTDRRKRSVSFDESLSTSRNNYAEVRNDPTLEMQLSRDPKTDFEGNCEISEHKDNHINITNSCGILSSLSEEEEIKEEKIQVASSTTY